MRYRAQTDSGDMRFGGGVNDWLIDSPEAVAQAARTRLQLLQGEWFLDTTEGTPWSTQILGSGTMQSYDWAIRERVLRTQGVREIDSYASQLNTETRALSVQVEISTIYGTAIVRAVL